ncbi:WecB/TagA/CpsF family glycosyltransferase [Haliscomenobacter hydrossis]|uniref:Glycosyl transferase, WecB/TagA/CpsF family n=1 Tax=Haliscomenobacter hydrossis (strain ATCC 27775 / DSM 1100 / LMG 10767 / O) TaxID=760192 RepID=F4KR32_HALH1|nr:WecB/TagA/CpsF family glycosyltransferase [Haliscomenobacter hydrossis]AEE53270.1 glycosyl transferase, WecB/TagA/CpsF family [Haliscomenobacter hydrossis DSM 1100]
MLKTKTTQQPAVQVTTTPFLHYTLFSGSLDELHSIDKALINTINQYSYCIAEQDPAFKQALLGAEILLPDGVAITASLRFLSGKRIQKIAGADLHQHLLAYLNQKGGRCFYLGASVETLQKIQKRLEQEYPDVEAGFYSPPFKAAFSKEDNAAMIEAVNAFQPEVLFIGMTAPKQEKWGYQFHADLDARLTCCIGAVFDFYAGSIQRPPQIWINLGLEWLGRLLREPKRLWKRYLYYGPIFAVGMLREKFKKTPG